MSTILTKAEAALLTAFIAFIAAAAVGGPFVAQSPHDHDLADQRAFFGVLHAMDVLSSIPFALAGVVGLACMWRLPRRSITNMQRAMALLFFCGLVMVALGCATYHLDPTDATLAVDRYCMALVMAGLVGLAAAGHVSERAGAAAGAASLIGGLLAAKVAAVTGNLLPWAVFQAGGVGLLWWLGTLAPRARALPVNWSLVIVAYGAAKLLEINDYAIYELTWHLVSGHTLKHLVASAAAWPVIAALASMRSARLYAPADEGPAQDIGVHWTNA